ncbi:class I SAM-dependent methyltransferase [Paenibacillus sp. GSMTC-2017]|nr:class I SAM-dependent methyltransferase [Paenibacillus sp. GSMTC-2017]
MDRISHIRNEEKSYHDNCYEQNILFEPGSWMNKPVKTVMDLLPKLHPYETFSILDLGCGVGRNTIPIAEFLKSHSGKVIGVDLLESAVNGLHQYCIQFGVQDYIEIVHSDIESYFIPPLTHNLIVAVSALEHLSSEDALENKLKEMVVGTKINGINCIIIASNIRESIIEADIQIDPMFEILLSTERTFAILDYHYSGWEVLSRLVKPLSFEIERQHVPVLLTSDCITYVVRKLQ